MFQRLIPINQHQFQVPPLISHAVRDSPTPFSAYSNFTLSIHPIRKSGSYVPKSRRPHSPAGRGGPSGAKNKNANNSWARKIREEATMRFMLQVDGKRLAHCRGGYVSCPSQHHTTWIYMRWVAELDALRRRTMTAPAPVSLPEARNTYLFFFGRGEPEPPSEPGQICDRALRTDWMGKT